MKHLWLLAIVTSFLTIQGASGASQKKLIHTGWDQQTPAQLLENIQEAEARLPFDGLTINLTARDQDGKTLGTSMRSWMAGGWTRQHIAQDIADLKKIQFTRFKHNFIYTTTNSTISPKQDNRPDWFDDALWNDISTHMGLWAYAARETGCQGLVFDPESYSAFRWSHDKSSGKSYEETARQARRRGAQVMKAMAAEYLQMTVICYWLLSMSNLNSPKALEHAGYGLYPAFINGMLDELPPEMTLIDGSENGYWYKNLGSFLGSYQQVRSAASPSLDPVHRDKYRRQVLSGFGIYLDSHVNRSGYSVPPVDGSQMRALRYQLTNALQTSDEYVWVYGERWRWFTQDDTRRWETALPGVIRTLELSRDPAAILDEVPQAIAQGKLRNVAVNPEFDKAGAVSQANCDLGLDASQIAGFSKYGKSPISIDNNAGFESPSSVMIEGNSGTLIQSINVKESQSYYVRVRSRVEGSGVANLSIRWQTPESTWSNIEYNQVDYATPVDGSDWGVSEGFVRVPAGAGNMVLLLSSSNSTPADKVWFDKLEVYPLDDLYEAPNTYQAMIADRSAQNRVVNSDFKNDLAKGQIVPVTKFTGYWLWHEPQESPTHHALDNTTGYQSQESASMAGMKAGSIMQNIVVEPGQRYVASVHGRHQGKGSITFRIGWMRGDTWAAQDHNIGPRFEKVEGSDWSKAVAAGITVPQGVNRMVLILTARGQETADDRAWFDKLEVFKQD